MISENQSKAVNDMNHTNVMGLQPALFYRMTMMWLNFIRYTARKPEFVSPPVFFQKGSTQPFSDSNFAVRPNDFKEFEFAYQPGSPEIPIVIQLTVEEQEFASQCEVTLATLEKASDGTYSIKPLKQKIIADGVCYIIQEIYGIENKKDDSKDVEDDVEENGTECVICMCDTRDTLILPCRHLCLCNTCANSLRYQSSNCPICRSPFHALLQIKAVRKKTIASNTSGTNESERKENNSSDNKGEGYEEVPLVEALNGYLPPEGALGYSSRPSSVRRARSRSGSRPGSRKSLSRTTSRGSSRPVVDLPPIDKVERPQTAKSIYSRSSSIRSGIRAAIRGAPSLDATEDGRISRETEAEIEAEVKDDREGEDVVEELQASGNSRALRQLISNSPEEEAYAREDQKSELSAHIDVSLPGTPMGSDLSTRSGSSLSTQRTASTTAGSGSSILSANVQISTPSNVKVEETEDDNMEETT